MAAFAWLGGCGPTEAAPALPRLVHDQHDGFWWTEIGEQSAAVANFGPTFQAAEGRFRQWTLIIHLPGSSESLSCVQGLVALEGAQPIMAEGGSFRVDLRPTEGRVWEQVTEDADLATTVTGLY